MKVRNLFPVIQVENVAGTAAFYARHLEMDVVFDSDWYVQLRTTDGQELAVMRWDHDTVPEGDQKPAQGVLLSFEVDDVDAVHRAFVDSDVQIARSLRNEDFGQRHFIAKDPHGNLVDVITPIEPSKEFASAYLAD